MIFLYNQAMENAKKIIDFIKYAEGLKTELRHATKSDSVRESVADHSWRLSLALMLIVPHLSVKVDCLKALKMAIIHDIVEIEAKDIPVLEQINNKKIVDQKETNEKMAISSIGKKLGVSGREIVELWYEFEASQTNEAKIVKALDKLEGELQFLHDPVRQFAESEQGSIATLIQRTTELCSIDPFLQELDKITLKDRQNRIAPKTKNQLS